MAKQISVALLITLLSCSIASESASASKRVLMIGLDGVGGIYLPSANTPHLDSLASNGAVRYDYLNEGALVPSPPNSYGASGVNWSTILTGTSAASHGVSDNSFSGNKFTQFPSLFEHIKAHDPSLFTASIVTWSPLNTFVVKDSHIDLKQSFTAGSLFQRDMNVKDAAINLLSTGDPHAIFLHLDQVDGAGHSFSWGSPQYYAAIEVVDGLVGEIVAALNARPGVNSGDEDWLLLVTSDHGATPGAFSHPANQGLNNWQVPFFVSGPSVPDGVQLPQGTLRDVATTALWHLGIDPFGVPVEGRVRGIPLLPPNGIFGDLNQDGVVFGDGTGLADSDDVTAFLNGWFTTRHSSIAEAYAHGDLNLDGITDLQDWIILNRLDPAMAQAVWSALHQVPEPSGAVMLLCLAGGGLVWRPYRSGCSTRRKRP